MSEYIDVFTPDSVIAASVPAGGANPREVAYNNGAYALDREDIHLIYSVEKDTVFYIAAASEDFAGHVSAVTPLAAALPGMKGHQGDGAYVAIAESGYGVVIKKGTDLFSYVGDRQAVDAFVQSHNVPTFSITDNAAMPWEGYNLGAIRRATRLASVAIMVGGIFAIVSGFAWFLLASQSANVEAEATAMRRESDESMQKAADELNKFGVQPLVEVINEMQRLTSLATEVGGYMTYFKYEDGKEKWEIELPGWATADIIDRFGTGLEPSKDNARNLIIVRKNKPFENERRR